MLGLQKLPYIDKIGIIGKLQNAVKFSQMAYNFEIQWYLVWWQ